MDCLIANNVIVSPHSPLVRMEDEAIRTRWLANLVHGAEIGLPPHAGLRQADPQLHQAPDGLWRPTVRSPALGAAEGDFEQVTEDIEGKPRGTRKDVGCFQQAEASARYRPLAREDAGPTWR
jgi:hypothetical protein